MTEALFDLLLCAMILSVALAAMLGRDLFASVVFFIVYGMLVAIAWLRLGAVDVALAEAAIGAGLTGVLLLGAAARLRKAGLEDAAEPVGAAQAMAALGGFAVTMLVGYGFLSLPPGGEGLAPLVADNLARSGVENPVTAVLLNFRAYDTLLESVVLLVALAGVWSLAEDDAWGERPGLRQHVRMKGVLASFGRLLPPVGLIVGVYVVWVGGKQPGGAFQGGTILAAVWLLVSMAGLIEAPRVTSRALRGALVFGPVVFLAIAAAGALAGSMLALPEAAAGALILVIEAALTVSIAVTLALLVAGVPVRRERN